MRQALTSPLISAASARSLRPYGIALLLVGIGGLAMRLEADFLQAQATVLIVLFPIAMSAYLGGLGPGLFATLAGVLVSAYLLPPADSLAVDAAHDI